MRAGGVLDRSEGNGNEEKWEDRGCIWKQDCQGSLAVKMEEE